VSNSAKPDLNDQPSPGGGLKRAVRTFAQRNPQLFNPVWKAIFPLLGRSTYFPGGEHTDRRQAFSLHFQHNWWGSEESRSGPGSTLAATHALRRKLPTLLQRLEVKTLLDAPCGDLNWMRHVPLDGVRYIGADIVPELVEMLRQAHPDRTFQLLDIVKDPIPAADLWLCRDVLIHLPNIDAQAVLRQAASSGVRYFLTTHYPRVRENRDLEGPGGIRFVNLERAPFNLPPPLLMVDDFVAPQEPRVMALWSAEQLQRAI
jgi:hypothetical protein